MNQVVRRLVSVMAALTLILVGATSQAQTASAAGPLSFTFFNCEGGGGQFICDAEVTGGSGSYTFSWTGVAGHNDYGNASYAYGYCQIGKNYTARVTVTDSTGASISRGQTRPCYKYWP
jgi:hypothetical protein